MTVSLLAGRQDDSSSIPRAALPQNANIGWPPMASAPNIQLAEQGTGLTSAADTPAQGGVLLAGHPAVSAALAVLGLCNMIQKESMSRCADCPRYA